jgi:hypothetical protein
MTSITSTQARSAWCVRQFGADVKVHRRQLDAAGLLFAVMAFHCSGDAMATGDHWVYVTNGMSDRRMPWRLGPSVSPALRRYRVELLASTQDEAPWVVDALAELAAYPFMNETGFAFGHTLPVVSSTQKLWDGCVLGYPCNHERLNPLGIVADTLGGDPVFWLQVIGLKGPELEAAIELGGEAFLRSVPPEDPCFLDVVRSPRAW